MSATYPYVPIPIPVPNTSSTFVEDECVVCARRGSESCKVCKNRKPNVIDNFDPYEFGGRCMSGTKEYVIELSESHIDKLNALLGFDIQITDGKAEDYEVTFAVQTLIENL